MRLTYFFHASLNKNTCVDNASWALQWSHRFIVNNILLPSIQLQVYNSIQTEKRLTWFENKH